MDARNVNIEGQQNGLLANGHTPNDAARDRREPRCSVGSCLCAFVVDLITIVVMLILAPVLLCIVFLFCLIPIVDRLVHPRRQYMDGTSSAYINLLDGAVIHGIVISKHRVSADAVFAKFDKTYVSSGRGEFAQFKQRMVRSNLCWPYWADASANFDFGHHYKAINEKLTKNDLETMVSKIESQALDLERPLWELWHFENFTDEDGTACSATMLRIHHAWTDGFTGLRMMMQGATPNKPPEETAKESRPDRRRKLGLCELVHYYFVALRKLLLLQDDRPSIFKASAHLGSSDPKVVAWSRLKYSTVASLKELGKKLDGATINDILLVGFAGSLRRHARNTGVDLPDMTATAWVSRNPLKHIYADFNEVPFKWGNAALGAFYIPLPVGARHRELHTLDHLENLRTITSNPALMVEAGVATNLLSLFGWLPKCVAKVLWGPLCNKVSVSMSNVPGPQFNLEWCGLPVQRMLFFVPPTGTISLFCTIATWNGEVNVGMGVDGTLLDQEALRSISGELFEEELQELSRAVGAA